MLTPRRLCCCVTLGLVSLSLVASGGQAATRRPAQPKKKSVSPTSRRIPLPNGNISRLTRNALTYRGVRYRWGGASRRGTDCSGLMMQLFAKEGLRLPHNARAQYRMGKPVAFQDLQPGDLVFFNIRRRLGHVGLYIGEGRFIHASTPRSGVRIDSLSSGTYRRTFAGARRLIEAPKAPKDAEQLPTEIEPLIAQSEPEAPAPAAPRPTSEAAPAPAAQASAAPSP